MRQLGVGHTTIGRWEDHGYLFWELPRVYAVGHPGRTPESDLAAAVLYAGPGGMLSHASTVWWLGLLKYPPPQIHVSTPRRVQNWKNIVVHGRRTLKRIRHKGLPITTPSQAILDFAATGSHDLLRFVLANAEYQGLLDPGDLTASIGPGIKGARALREAIAIHLPELALTRSATERLLLMLCERFGLPIPAMNVYVGNWLVDAVWPDAKVIVEVDGIRGHRTKAQIERDHQRDLEVRALGYIVLRYTEAQIRDTPEAVVADLLRYL
jgi:very-short-patch-repair endonuclease